MWLPSFVPQKKLKEPTDQADILTSDVQYILPVFDVRLISNANLTLARS